MDNEIEYTRISFIVYYCMDFEMEYTRIKKNTIVIFYRKTLD